MASETRLVFNSEGFREILLSSEVKNLVTESAEEIKNKADANNMRGGDGFYSNVQVGGYGGGRWIGFVGTTDKESIIAESEDKALTNAYYEGL